MTVHRFPDWEARLSALIKRINERPFEYGEFDCGQFARLAIKEMTGIDLGKDSAHGYCDGVSAGLLLRRAGAEDMGALAEIIAGLHGIAEIDPAFAKRGDIVLASGPDGPGLAVIVGDFALAPSRGLDGVGRVPRENWLRAWSTENIASDANIGELFSAVDGPFTFLIPILISMILSFALKAIGSVLSKAFTKKPKKSPLNFEDRTITIRQSIEPWHGIIGSARVGGDIFFFEKLGSDVWLGIEWAHHQCKAIDSIYADDEQIFVNADGSVEGTHNGFLEVYHHLGATPETADAALKAAFPLLWTDAHRGDGITYSIFRFVNLATNWGNAIPNMTADLRGALWTDPRTGVRSFTDNLAVIARGLLMDENFGEGAPGEEIDTDNFIAQANICDEEIAIPAWTEHWKESPSVAFTVNTTTDVITLGAALTFFTPDKVYVWAGTALAAPLAAQTAYYYRRLTSTTGALYPTANDATNDTNRINLTDTGTGTQRMTLAAATFTMLGRETTFTANATTDLITTGTKMGWSGERIASFDTTGTLPAPLTVGTRYRVLQQSNGLDYFVFDLTGSSALNLTAAGSGTHTVRIGGKSAIVTPANTDPAIDTLLFPATYWLSYMGETVQIKATSGTVPGGLVDGGIYFIIVVNVSPIDGNTVRLAATRAEAEAGNYLDITADPSADFTIFQQTPDQDEVLGAVTGMVAQIIDAGDPLFSPFVFNTDYYFIRRGRQIFQLAASLQNALDGVNVEPKPANGYGALGTFRFGITLKRERRYTANGVIDSDQDTLDIEKALGACCAGTLLEPLGSGKWRLKVGAYPIPLGVLQLKHVRQGGQPELQCMVEGSENATSVKGVYSSPLNFDHPSDIPAVSDPAFVAEDGGEQHVLDVQYPFTNSKFMARRIANIDLRRKRMQRTLRLPVTLPAGFKFEFGDGVHVDLSPLPIKFDAEIAGWNFQAKSEGDAAPKPSIDLILRETDPWIYR